MTPEAIKAHLVSTGWELRPTGVYVHEMSIHTARGLSDKRLVRVKFNKLTLRIELKSDRSSFWIRIGGDAYKNIKKLPDGRVQVLSFYLPASRSNV